LIALGWSEQSHAQGSFAEGNAAMAMRRALPFERREPFELFSWQTAQKFKKVRSQESTVVSLVRVMIQGKPPANLVNF
jgi:hypothetical protein